MFNKADLHSSGSSAEDNMKFSVVQPIARDLYDQSLYFEAARRVVFKNCMASCELTNEQIPNFNKNFYYNQKGEQACLQSCYNTRMELHFGEHNAKRYNLFIDFEQMKAEYHNYEKWLPTNRIRDQYARGFEEKNIA